MSQLSLDLGDEGRRRKEIGQQFTLDVNGPWQDQASILVLYYLRTRGPSLMEDARVFALACGLPEPSHLNAWGALTSALHKSGEITTTGRWMQSRRAKAHARVNPVWRLA